MHEINFVTALTNLSQWFEVGWARLLIKARVYTLPL